MFNSNYNGNSFRNVYSSCIIWLLTVDQRSLRPAVGLFRLIYCDHSWCHLLLSVRSSSYLSPWLQPSLLHQLPRQTKAIHVLLVWFGSGPPKSNACKPYNMVICSGWGKEPGFINNGVNRTHIKLKFGLLEGDEGCTEGLGETEVIQ